jgi:hypothetical protein
MQLINSSRIIWQTDIDGASCRLVSGRRGDEELYSRILSVRCQTDPRWPDQRTPVDDYSDHYCMLVDDEPVGSLGVTRLIDGPVFLSEYVPQLLSDNFYDTLCSAYRFRILSEFRRTSPLVPGINLSRHIVREVWREQLMKGVRLDVINIESSYIPLYQRMGYEICEGFDYIDPALGTPSSIMYLAADVGRPSIIQDILQDLGISFSSERVRSALQRKVVAVG